MYQTATNDILAIWRKELLIPVPRFDKSTWANRLNPLDVLRCATLYLADVPSNALSPATRERKALEVILHFLALTQKRNSNVLALRRVQALLFALDLAVKQCEYDIALDMLLIYLRQESVPLDASWAPIILLPHFGPFFVQLETRLRDNSLFRIPAPSPDALAFDLDALSPDKVAAIRALRVEEETWTLVNMSDRLLDKGYHDRQGALRIREYQFLPLEPMSLPVLVCEVEMATRRLWAEGKGDPSVPSIFRRQSGATAWAIREAELRLGYCLPQEYKRIVQFMNGWDCMYILSLLGLL